MALNDTKADHQLVVDGLPPLPRDNDIRSLFGRFGAITEVRVDANMHRAFVNFSTAEALQKAVAAAPPRLKGMNLRVSLPEDHEHRCESTRLVAYLKHDFRRGREPTNAVRLVPAHINRCAKALLRLGLNVCIYQVIRLLPVFISLRLTCVVLGKVDG